MRALGTRALLLGIALIVSAAGIGLAAGNPGPVRRTYNREFSHSDGYVNFGAVLAEFAVASRHLEDGNIRYKGALNLDTEISVERAKAAFAGRLRNSFRERYPAKINVDMTLEEESMVLPYYISPDVARHLRSEGYDTALNPVIERPATLAATRHERPAGARELFEFPIVCDTTTGECTTEWVCWSISLALNGMTMEETCNLLEKVQTLADGSWTIDDWLSEIPNFIDLLKDLDGIAGLISTKSCAATATQFSVYSSYGDEAVFYYPKAICMNTAVFRGCMMELLVIVALPLVDQIEKYLPTDVVDILTQINSLLQSIYLDTPSICANFRQIGLLSDGSLLTFLDSWEDLFTLVSGTSTTKLERLLNVFSTLLSWDLINDYLPSIPTNCDAPLANAATKAYNTVFGPDAASSSEIPSAICDALGETTVIDCITLIAQNIDDIDWMAESLGNGYLHELGDEVLPSLCEAFADVSSLSVDAIFSQLPLLLRVYKKLSLDVLSSILPGVHEALIDCAEDFADLAEDVEDVLDDTTGMIKLVCSDKVSNNDCFVELSDGIDQLGVASLGEGTLRTVITETLPEACDITNTILSEDELSVQTILAQLPAIVEWYESVSSISVFQSYIPKWPSEQCTSAVVQNLTNDLLLGIEQTDILPAKLCTLSSGATQSCMLAIGESLETSSLVKSLFSSTVSTVGPNATFYVLFYDLFPELCTAIHGSSIDVGDLVAAFPVLLNAITALDIIPLREQFPSIHTLLQDKTCSKQFAAYGTWIAQVIDGEDTQVITHICARFSKMPCLVKLSRALDKIAFVREKIGKGTLELIVEDIVPQVCKDIRNTAGEFSVDKLLESLPSLLTLFDSLTSVSTDGSDTSTSVYPLQNYLPQIPRNATCRKGFQTIAKDIYNFLDDGEVTFSQLINEMCVSWKSAGYYECLADLGDQIDATPFLVNLLGSTGLIQAIPNTLLPSACSILAPEDSMVDSIEFIISKLPEIITWYSGLRSSDLIPSFLEDYMPEFPTENCSSTVLADVQSQLLQIVNEPTTALNILCEGLTAKEKNCLVAIGDGIDNADALQEAIGIEDNFLQDLIQTQIPTACSIIGSDFDSIDVTNLIGKLPQILHFMTDLKESMPSTVANYIPDIPHDTCDSSYESAAAKFVANPQPLAICDLDSEEAECFALIGDSVDDVEMLRELIGGRGLLRYAVTTVRVEACEAVENIEQMELTKLSDQIPTALSILEKLNNFTLLDPYIPDIPSSCTSEIPSITASLATAVENSNSGSSDSSLEEAVASTLCAITSEGQACLADLGYSLSEVEWIAGIVPDAESIALDLLKLLPLLCALFDESGSFPSADEILTYLPTVISLFDALRDVSFVEPYLPDVSDACMENYKDLAETLSPVGVTGVPGVLCNMTNATQQCFREISWPLVIEDGVAAAVVDTLPTACALVDELGTFDYNSIISSLPYVLDLLDQLHEIDALSEYIPDIDDDCSALFKSSLIPRFEEDGAIEGTCGITSDESTCIVSMVDSILDVTVIANLAAQQLETDDPDNIKTLVTTLLASLPSVCSIVEGVDILDNVFIALDKMVSILQQLSQYKVFQGIIPTIDDTCADEYHTSIADVQSSLSASDDNIALLPHAICLLVLDNSDLESCLQDIGAQVDQSPLIGLSSLSVETVIVAFTQKIMPRVCSVIARVLDETGNVNVTEAILSIPDVAQVYADAATAVGPTYLPAFPDEECTESVLEDIAAAINNGDILDILCGGITDAGKVCIRSLGSTIEDISFVNSMLGRDDLISTLLGDPLDAACAALSYDTDVDITSILGHLDTILYAIDLANRLAPSLFEDYFPQIPGGNCTDISYPRISALLTNFKAQKLCLLVDDDRECIALLGDNLEETEFFRNFLYGDLEEMAVSGQSLVRTVMDALPDILCVAMDELGEISFEGIISALPAAFDLLRELHGYPALQAYVPWVPDICISSVVELTTRLTSETLDPVSVMCGLTTSETTCIVELGASIDILNFTSGLEDLLNATVQLIPSVCEIIGSSTIEATDILRHLPELMVLFEKVDVVARSLGLYDVDIGTECHSEMQDMASRFSEVSVDMLPDEICEATSSEFACLRKASTAIEQLPLVSDTIPEGLMSNVISLMETTACPLWLSTEDTDYLGFVSALPDLITILSQLEEMDFLSSYIPVISSECKTLFAVNITAKLENGAAIVNEMGLVNIFGSIDFSGLTSILCSFNEAEGACFREAGHAIVAIPLMSSLSSSLGGNYSLSTMVDSAFDIREYACSLLDEIAEITASSIMYSLSDILHIMEELNSFPVISEYVPTFKSECLEVVDSFAEEIDTSDAIITTVCGLDDDGNDCIVYIAHQLDTISQVRSIFEVATDGEYDSLEAYVKKLIYDVVIEACEMMNDIATGMEGINLSEFIFKIPDFIDALRTMKSMPFIEDLAPQVSDTCLTVLESVVPLSSDATTEIDGVTFVCESSDEVRACVLELNDKLKEIEYIGEHIPDGVVEAFIDSLDSGCKLFQDSDIDEESFLKTDMPVLMRNAGIIAGVQDSCLLPVNVSNLCSIGDDCLAEYFSKLSALPLLGKFIPSWASDVVVDLCAVQSGDGSMADFIETYLPVIIQTVFEDSNSTCASKDVDTTTPLKICTSLGTQCVQELANNLPSLAPDGISELLVTGCEVLTSGDETIFALLPYLGSLLDILAFMLGYPSDTCAAEIKSSILVEDFDAEMFCTGMSSECTTEVVKTLSSIPFIGDYLPIGTDQLIGALCGVLKDGDSISSLMEHVPTIIELLGKIIIGGHLDISGSCQTQIEDYVVNKRTGSVNIRNLCLLSNNCTSNVIDALQELPLVGQYIPDSIPSILNDACVLQSEVRGSDYLEISETANSAFIRMLPRVLLLLGKVLGDEVAPGDGRLLSTANTSSLGCGTMLIAYAEENSDAFRMYPFCSEVSPNCIQYACAKLTTMPVVNEYLHPRTGEVLSTTCTIMNATSRDVALEAIPQLLSSTASLLDLDTSCTSQVEDVAALFKSRGGAIDADTLCTKVPNATCLAEVAAKLQNLPYVGLYVPNDVETLIKDTCDLMANDDVVNRASLSTYLAKEGPILLQIAGLMAGVDTNCETWLEQISDISVSTMCQNATCVAQLSDGLETLPLVGDYIPKGLSPLFDGICEFAAETATWKEFVENTLSKLMYIVTQSITGDTSCATQLERFSLDIVNTTGYILAPVKSLCHISDTCIDSLTNGLETLPLWGPFLPSKTSQIIHEICNYTDLYASSLSDMDVMIKTLNTYWPELMELVLNMVDIDDETCMTSLADKSTACVNEGSCLELLIQAYKNQLPLIGQLFPDGVDAGIESICQLTTASKADLLELLYKSGGILDNLILWLPADALTDTDECADKFASAAALPEAGTPGSWQKVLSCTVGASCLTPLSRNLLKLANLSITAAETALFEAVLTDQPCDDATNGTDSGSSNEGSITLAPSGNNLSSSSEETKTNPIVYMVIGASCLLAIIFAVFAVKIYRLRQEKDDPDTVILDRRASQSIVPSAIDNDYGMSSGASGGASSAVRSTASAVAGIGRGAPVSAYITNFNDNSEDDDSDNGSDDDTGGGVNESSEDEYDDEPMNTVRA